MPPETAAQQPEQAEGGGVQEQAELIGQKASASLDPEGVGDEA